jgi:tetratricopeptide (TPR) repeat protein
MQLSAFAQKPLLEDKEMQQIIMTGLDKMYNYQFDEAEKYFVKVKEKYPQNPAYSLLQSMSFTLEMTVENSFKSRAAEGLKYLETTVSLAEKMLEKNHRDPEAIFYMLAARSSLAVIYSQTGQTMKAVNEARRAYGLIKTADELKDKYVDFYFPVGLYNYYVVQYAENHPVFKPFTIFFTKGDKKKGLEQLNKAIQNGVYSKVESAMYTGHIYLRYEENHVMALKYTQPLVEKYPANVYFKINQCEALVGTKKYKEAEYLAYDLYKTGKVYPKIAAFTFYGLMYERHFNKPDTAKAYFQQAINLAQKCELPANDFIGQCYAGLGRYYHKKGNTEKAAEAYRKCEETTDYLSLMKEAEAYLEKYD